LLFSFKINTSPNFSAKKSDYILIVYGYLYIASLQSVILQHAVDYITSLEQDKAQLSLRLKQVLGDGNYRNGDSDGCSLKRKKCSVDDDVDITTGSSECIRSSVDGLGLHESSPMLVMDLQCRLNDMGVQLEREKHKRMLFEEFITRILPGLTADGLGVDMVSGQNLGTVNDEEIVMTCNVTSVKTEENYDNIPVRYYQCVEL